MSGPHCSLILILILINLCRSYHHLISTCSWSRRSVHNIPLRFPVIDSHSAPLPCQALDPFVPVSSHLPHRQTLRQASFRPHLYRSLVTSDESGRLFLLAR